MGIKISAIEYYLPNKIITNADLENENNHWNLDNITKKTGVVQRHIADVNETAFDLSVEACNKLFKKCNKNLIDGIIYCTQSPDYIMPSNAFLLHQHFNLNDNVFAYDFNHACTGYIYSVIMASSYIKSGVAENVLIVNADTYSKFINKRDKSTRVLFGDGAAATMISKTSDKKGILDYDIKTSSKDYRNFWVEAGGIRMPRSESTSLEYQDKKGNIISKNNIQMNGIKVWSFINSVVPKQINKILTNNEFDYSNIDQFIFHQSSLMTIESLIRILKINKEKVFINISEIGNTVSASIPIAMKDALDQNIIESDSRIIISGFGVGLSYGTLLMEL